MNDTTQKIASEAASDWVYKVHAWRGRSPAFMQTQKNRLTAIIQSAIEKATEQLQDQLDCANEVITKYAGEEAKTLRAAHASKVIDEDILDGRVAPDLGVAHAREPLGMTGVQAEWLDASHAWTEETVLEITENLLGVKPTRKARKAIAAAHNATLQRPTPATASEQ